jgi:hypothetical protein
VIDIFIFVEVSPAKIWTLVGNCAMSASDRRGWLGTQPEGF